MTSPGSKSRIRWEGDSNKEIRNWPEDVKGQFGLELDRLENFEEPLHSKPMAPALPGTNEIFRQDADLWYRLIYWLHSGWIYVLHCFTKKTNKTSKGDVEKAKQRMKLVGKRNDAPPPVEEQEEAKSA